MRKLFKKGLLTVTSLASVAGSTAAVVSCGNVKNADDNSGANDQNAKIQQQNHYNQEVERITNELKGNNVEYRYSVSFAKTKDQIKSQLITLINSTITETNKYIEQFSSTDLDEQLSPLVNTIYDFSKSTSAPSDAQSSVIQGIVFKSKVENIKLNDPISFTYHYSFTAPGKDVSYYKDLLELSKIFLGTSTNHPSEAVVLDLSNGDTKQTILEKIVEQLEGILINYESAFTILNPANMNDLTQTIVEGLTDQTFNITPGDYSKPSNELTKGFHLWIPIADVSESEVPPVDFDFQYTIKATPEDSTKYESAVAGLSEYLTKINESTGDPDILFDFSQIDNSDSGWKDAFNAKVVEELKLYFAIDANMINFAQYFDLESSDGITVRNEESKNILNDPKPIKFYHDENIYFTFKPKFPGISSFEVQLGFYYKAQ